MRRIVTLVALGMMALAVMVVRGPGVAGAQAYNYDPTMVGITPNGRPRVLLLTDAGASYVVPAPGSLKHPKKITLAGAAFTCAQITRTDGGSNPGQCLRIDCGVDCAYDLGVFLPDGGVDVQDGTYNTTADGNPLPSATPENICAGSNEDGLCVYSATAGSAYVSQRKP